jgi:hypothetical protein
MKKSFFNDINIINENIKEAEILLQEAMTFCEDDYDETADMGNEDYHENDMNTEPQTEASVESYVDHIRKYALNGLSALCENPESEEYQMLKKIFQMCDKKPEKKEGMMESYRLFGVLKENKNVLFETNVNKGDDFKHLKNLIVKEAIDRGIQPSTIRLVSEKKIIK